MMTGSAAFAKFQAHLDETSTPDLPQETSSRIIRYFVSLLRNSCDDREVLITAAMQAYEQYVRPFDLPGVPNVIEPTVDRLIGEALRTTLEFAADSICGE